MPNNKTLSVRVTNDQHRRARNLADAHGFVSISQLIRTVLFEQDLFREQKIDRIYEAICKRETLTKAKKPHTIKPAGLRDYTMLDMDDPFAGCGTQVEEAN